MGSDSEDHGDDDDELLGLSLTLGLPHNNNINVKKKKKKKKKKKATVASATAASASQYTPRPSLELNLSPVGRANASVSSAQFPAHDPRNQRISWNLLLHHPPSEKSLDSGTFEPGGGGGGGTDVGRVGALPYPTMASLGIYMDQDENAASSPNSTVSSISAGKRAERDHMVGHHENEGERTSCSRGSDEDDGGGVGGGCGVGDGEGRKKLRLSREQSTVLEETFKEHSTLNPKQKQALADRLNLRPRQVEVWFQNRRARTKLKQTEVDCEYLKRCCENLTQENRRLQKEVQELRALKLSPQLYMNMNPPTTLTMCPSCERVATLSSSSSPSATSAAAVGPLPGQQSSVPINPWAALQMRHQPVHTTPP